MDCASVEQRLSDYADSSLPAAEMEAVRRHLADCAQCAGLLRAMRTWMDACRSYPVLEMDGDLLETILLRTSGRPRTLSLREQLQRLLQPLVAPRLAAGAALAAMFLLLTFHFMLPRVSRTLSAVSALEAFNWMDRGVQYVYGEGLKAFNKKDAWMAEFSFFKQNASNKLRHVMEQIDVPMEGQKKPVEPVREKKPSPDARSSRLLSWQACLEQGSEVGRL